ncbi:hypothetical protein ACLKA6_001180 [Drosophila palustris]
MLSKIVCDLCNRAFEGVDVFAEHYSKCTGPLNAFQVMMEAARNKASSRKTPATNEMEQSTTLVKASTAISSEAEMDQTSTSVEGSSSLSSGELSELPTTSKALKRPGVIVNRPAKTAKYDDVHCRLGGSRPVQQPQLADLPKISIGLKIPRDQHLQRKHRRCRKIKQMKRFGSPRFQEPTTSNKGSTEKLRALTKHAISSLTSQALAAPSPAVIHSSAIVSAPHKCHPVKLRYRLNC